MVSTWLRSTLRSPAAALSLFLLHSLFCSPRPFSASAHDVCSPNLFRPNLPLSLINSFPCDLRNNDNSSCVSINGVELRVENTPNRLILVKLSSITVVFALLSHLRVT